jgi:16S rRNA (cytosine967-C5)-methyltransferase
VADALALEAQDHDAVLLDAPCSATGTIRRHPDLPAARDGSEVAGLVKLQDRLVDHALSLLRPGGRLVLATCSLLPDENEAQIDAFLARNPGFRAGPAVPLWPGEPPSSTLSLTPLRHGTDGFYGAVRERVA